MAAASACILHTNHFIIIIIIIAILITTTAAPCSKKETTVFSLHNFNKVDAVNVASMFVRNASVQFKPYLCTTSRTDRQAGTEWGRSSTGSQTCSRSRAVSTDSFSFLGNGSHHERPAGKLTSIVSIKHGRCKFTQIPPWVDA